MKLSKKEKVQRKINYIVISILAIICVVGYFQREKLMEDTATTTCQVVDVTVRSGRHAHKVTIIEYQVDGIKYTQWENHYSPKIQIGDCYNVEYSTKDPNCRTVDWEHKINANDKID